MRRNALIVALFAAGLGVVAQSEPAAAGEAGPAALDQSVSLATVALPLVFDGQVVNYVFVSVKLRLTPRADSLALRGMEPYFRDALVRAAHRTPFVRAGDFNHLDEGKLKAAMYREASAIVGSGKIAGVDVLSQTAQHRLAASRPAAGVVP